MGSESTSKELKRYANLLRLNWPVTLEEVNKYKEKLESGYLKKWAEHTAQGQGVKEFHNDSVANEWLKRGDILKPSLIAKAISLRTDTAGTRMAIRRDPHKRLTVPANCRKCGYATENLPHVLGQCINTKNSRIRRHDEIKEFIKNKMTENSVVLDEPRLHHQSKLYKPDLVVVNEGGAFIVDVTVRYEKSDYVVKAAEEKSEKYKILRKLVSKMFERDKVAVAPRSWNERGAPS